jgi:NADPH2:quinone reductase
MKAVVVKEFGGPEVCKLESDLPIPEPNANQIQIRVHAVGINPVDTYIRAGTHTRRPPLPYIPGFDCAGVVTKVGASITTFAPGDRVFTTSTESGCYSEYTLSKPLHTFKLDPSLSFEAGSALGIPYFTAYRALFLKGKARPGEWALVHGASGGVGIAAVQLAKAVGLNVIGTAGTAAGLELVRAQGADHVFNHKDVDYMARIKEICPEGLDIIIEMLANVNLEVDIQNLRWKRGRVLIVGSRGNIEISPRFLMAKETSVSGVTLFTSDQDDFNEMYAHLSSLIRIGAVRPVLAKTYELGEAGVAHEEIMSGSGAQGRLTLRLP